MKHEIALLDLNAKLTDMKVALYEQGVQMTQEETNARIARLG